MPMVQTALRAAELPAPAPVTDAYAAITRSEAAVITELGRQIVPLSLSVLLRSADYRCLGAPVTLPEPPRDVPGRPGGPWAVLQPEQSPFALSPLASTRWP